ncbi:MAG: DUF1559 domain-containing protein [Planctomycetales bacterium]|nr:DUF1559 domain-containing protein [Planctomycetales bacterium]
MSLTSSREKSSADRPRKVSGGFTLVELLVVISIIGMLVAILLPAVHLARESGRKAVCGSNLRQFGIGLAAHAELKNGQFCTGAFDWQRDGCVTEIGWVADLVNMEVPVGEMLCPSSPAQVSEALNNMFNADMSTMPEPSPCNIPYYGDTGTLAPDGTPILNACRKLLNGAATYTPGSEARRKFIEDEIYNRHYNTNYTASWFLVRSGVTLTTDGNLHPQISGCGSDLRSRNSTLGPLNQNRLGRSVMGASFVPLLGDGATNGILAQQLGDVVSGEMVSLSFTQGPVLKTTLAAPAAFSTPTAKNVWWAVWNNNTLQDYRGFAPLHRGTVNVLFADGSVRNFSDTNGDGYLNNGFPASAASGFASDKVEVTLDQMESQWSLADKVRF